MPELTPEQEEARFRIRQRDRLERQHAPKIEAALQAMITAVIQPGMTDQEIAAAPNRLDENSKELEAALLAYVLAMSDIAIDAAQDDLAEMGLAVDVAEVDAQAKEEARRRVLAAMPLLIATTRKAMQAALPVWLANPQRNIDDLLIELAPQMSTARAEGIARTEGTDIFRRGAGVVGGALGAASLVQLEWYTMRDERVCHICRPMLGKRRPLNGSYDMSLPVQQPPPAHPWCRCGELMVIRSAS